MTEWPPEVAHGEPEEQHPSVTAETQTQVPVMGPSHTPHTSKGAAAR